jgi:hypothetical protein
MKRREEVSLGIRRADSRVVWGETVSRLLWMKIEI